MPIYSKALRAALSVCAAFMLCSVTAPAWAARVGISMPTDQRQRWLDDGYEMKIGLEAAGHEVALTYAGDNDVALQKRQITEMIDQGATFLIITAADRNSLVDVLKDCRDKKITVIAYDRLIAGTPNLSYYVSFDNYKIGVMQARYLESMLELATSKQKRYIEIFSGSKDDSNATYILNGSLSVLQPYLDKGTVVCRSAQTTLEQTAVQNWRPELAEQRMSTLIKDLGYGPEGTKLDAVLSPNDSIARGIIVALQKAGYDQSNIPLTEGQDCDKRNVKLIVDGLQGMSVFKDTRELALMAVAMVDASVKGQEVPVNDTTSYDNGLGPVSAFLMEPVMVSRGNLREVLFDSGYYDESVILNGQP